MIRILASFTLNIYKCFAYNLLGGHMSKIVEFKSFVKNNPKLINYVRDNNMTWQSFYEMYDLYGENSEVWDKYLVFEKKEVNGEKKKGIPSFNDVINMAKNMDVDKMQEGITSLQKAISLFSDLFIKNDDNVNKSTYTPRPVYRSFED